MNGFMKKWLEKYYVILGVLLMAVCVAALVLDAARIAAARMWFGAAFAGAIALLLLPPACLCLGWLWRMASGLAFLVLAWLPRPGYTACLRVMLKEKSRQLRMLEAENASLRRNAQELNESMIKMQNDIREERLTRNLKRMAWDEMMERERGLLQEKLKEQKTLFAEFREHMRNAHNRQNDRFRELQEAFAGAQRTDTDLRRHIEDLRRQRDEMQRNRDGHLVAGLRRKLADYRELAAELNGRIAEQGMALSEISAAYRKLEETCRRLEKEALAARLNRPGHGEARLPKLELPPAPEMLAAGA